MKCIRFDVCKRFDVSRPSAGEQSSMKCIRFDVCKDLLADRAAAVVLVLNEVHTF